MKSNFTEWCNDLTFSKVCLYAKEYAEEESTESYGAGWDKAIDYSMDYSAAGKCHDLAIPPDLTQTFEEFLMDCFNKEHGGKIQELNNYE